MSSHTMDCPICEAEITVSIDPGEPRTFHHPGSAPGVEDVSGCACHDLLNEEEFQQEHDMTPESYEEYLMDVAYAALYEPEYDPEYDMERDF